MKLDSYKWTQKHWDFVASTSTERMLADSQSQEAVGDGLFGFMKTRTRITGGAQFLEGDSSCMIWLKVEGVVGSLDFINCLFYLPHFQISQVLVEINGNG